MIWSYFVYTACIDSWKNENGKVNFPDFLTSFAYVYIKISGATGNYFLLWMVPTSESYEPIDDITCNAILFVPVKLFISTAVVSVPR
jgi:hypothetical protein